MFGVWKNIITVVVRVLHISYPPGKNLKQIEIK